MSPELKAYERGYEAQRDGFSKSVNPYQLGGKLHERWEEGWDIAEAEEEDLCG
jgi:ribosome modulation factor